MKKIVLTVIVALVVCSFAFAAGEREIDPAAFPERPITAWVPWGAGGGSDIVFRTLAEVFPEYSGGQQLLIRNVPGAAGAVGTAEYMSVARPDGYDILTWAGAQTIKTHVSQVDYSIHDFAPVIKLISNYTYILVRDDSPYQTLQDFVDDAKSRPGEISWGHAGTGGGGHLSSILFNQVAGTEVTYIPFGGGGPAATGLLAGDTEISMNIPPEGLSNIEAGQLRGLATLSPERLEQIPDIPTAIEQGFDIVYSQFRGAVTHKDTPDEIVQRLHDILKQSLEDPRVQQRYYDMIVIPTYAGPEEYGRENIEEDEMFEQIIREYGIGDKYH